MTDNKSTSISNVKQVPSPGKAQNTTGSKLIRDGYSREQATTSLPLPPKKD